MDLKTLIYMSFFFGGQAQQYQKYNLMNGIRKRVKKMESQNKKKQEKALFEKIHQRILSTSLNNEIHPFLPLFEKYNEAKHPILPTVSEGLQVYKNNSEKKKRPLDLYLQTINQLYKKRDLDILLSPIATYSVFEMWSPKEIIIFEGGFQNFGKQFQFIAQLIQTKNAKQVYEFYLQWKNSSHYKSYKIYQNRNNRDWR